MGTARKRQITPTSGFHFGNDHGDRTTLLAVAAPIEKASPAVASVQRLAVRANIYGKPLGPGDLGWQFRGSPFTHYLSRWWQSGDVADLSRQLDTLVVVYCFEDTSGWRGFRVYDKGQCVESYDWGLGDAPKKGEKANSRSVRTEDGKPLHHRMLVEVSKERDKELQLWHDYRFRSERRKVAASLVTDHDRMLDEACRFYGVLMPDYGRIPCSEEGYEPTKGDDQQYIRVDLLVQPTAEDMTPANFRLQEAITALDVKALQVAIAAGAQLDEVAGLTATPIEVAAQNTSRDPEKAAAVIRVLASAGVPADAVVGHEAETPLLELFNGFHRAAAKIVPVVEALLDAGADVNAVGRRFMMKDQTALHRAALSSCPALVLLLLARGANPNAKGPRGKTPRQMAELAIKDYEKGWPGAEEAIPKLRRIISYLLAAEQGKKPSGDFKKEYAADMADELRATRRTKASATKLRQAMDTIEKATRKATKASPGKRQSRIKRHR